MDVFPPSKMPTGSKEALVVFFIKDKNRFFGV
jgi:hypothetical protein